MFQPVVLSTMNPINERIFFRTYKGVLKFKKVKKIKVRMLQMKIKNIPMFRTSNGSFFFTTRY